MATGWFQKTIAVRAKARGCHLVTDDVVRAIGAENLRPFKIGLAHLFILHTSASLSINENYDSDVRRDMEDALNRIAPEEGVNYRHSMEGKDDMPGECTHATFLKMLFLFLFILIRANFYIYFFILNYKKTHTPAQHT
jgi:secondary thiamine-phosphate synthase enzyme